MAIYFFDLYFKDVTVFNEDPIGMSGGTWSCMPRSYRKVSGQAREINAPNPFDPDSWFSKIKPVVRYCCCRKK